MALLTCERVPLNLFIYGKKTIAEKGNATYFIYFNYI